MFNLEKNIIPKPKELKNSGLSIEISRIGKGGFFVTADDSNTLVKEGAGIVLSELYKRACISPSESGYEITVKVDEGAPAFIGIDSDEAYYIDVQDTEAVLCGKTERGAFYASVTFTKMIHIEGDSVMLAKAYIRDFPDFEKRGYYIETRYGTEFLTLDNWKEIIDYFADMKANYLSIGVYTCWGTQYDGAPVEYLYVPIKSRPKLLTPKINKYYSVNKGEWFYEKCVLPTMFEQDFLGEVIAYANKRNVHVVPVVNSLGHNSLLPRMYPETAAILSDGTRARIGFCTSADATYELLFDIYGEIFENYLKPNGVYDIGIGLDEVPEEYICRCVRCKNLSHGDVLLRHIVRICKHLKEIGIKTVKIYHDMMFRYNLINEKTKELFIQEGIYDMVLFDWWTYEDVDNIFWGRLGDINNLFHSIIKPMTGYNNWGVIGDTIGNIRACAEIAKEKGYEGMESYTSYERALDKNYLTLADVSWNNSCIKDEGEFDERYAYRYYPDQAVEAIFAFKSMVGVMRHRVTYLPEMSKYEYTAYSYRRTEESTGEIKTVFTNFPGDAYKKLISRLDEDIPMMEKVYQKASSALEFFENTKYRHDMNKTWTVTAMHYKNLADQYLTIYKMAESYNNRITSAFDFIRELDRLIKDQERLMSLAESVRIHATAITCLRNMSIFRQTMIDLRDYFKRGVLNGIRPDFDITDWSGITTAAFDFLR